MAVWTTWLARLCVPLAFAIAGVDAVAQIDPVVDLHELAQRYEKERKRPVVEVLRERADHWGFDTEPEWTVLYLAYLDSTDPLVRLGAAWSVNRIGSDLLQEDAQAVARILANDAIARWEVGLAGELNEVLDSPTAETICSMLPARAGVSQFVSAMHRALGPAQIPVLLRLVDRCRDAELYEEETGLLHIVCILASHTDEQREDLGRALCRCLGVEWETDAGPGLPPILAALLPRLFAPGSPFGLNGVRWILPWFEDSRAREKDRVTAETLLAITDGDSDVALRILADLGDISVAEMLERSQLGERLRSPDNETLPLAESDPDAFVTAWLDTDLPIDFDSPFPLRPSPQLRTLAYERALEASDLRFVASVLAQLPRTRRAALLEHFRTQCLEQTPEAIALDEHGHEFDWALAALEIHDVEGLRQVLRRWLADEERPDLRDFAGERLLRVGDPESSTVLMEVARHLEADSSGEAGSRWIALARSPSAELDAFWQSERERFAASPTELPACLHGAVAARTSGGFASWLTSLAGRDERIDALIATGDLDWDDVVAIRKCLDPAPFTGLGGFNFPRGVGSLGDHRAVEWLRRNLAQRTATLASTFELARAGDPEGMLRLRRAIQTGWYGFLRDRTGRDTEFLTVSGLVESMVDDYATNCCMAAVGPQEGGAQLTPSMPQESERWFAYVRSVRPDLGPWQYSHLLQTWTANAR